MPTLHLAKNLIWLIGVGGFVIHSTIMMAGGDNQPPITFHFTEDRANPFSSIFDFNGACDIHVNSRLKNYPVLTFKFVLKRERAIVIQGHTRSGFCTDDSGKVLFFAQFPHNGTGCTILAYSLQNGKELWKTRLHALGITKQIDHLRYSNKVDISARLDSVRVWGRESFGDYSEKLDPRTGKIVAHKVYPRTEGKKAGNQFSSGKTKKGVSSFIISTSLTKSGPIPAAGDTMTGTPTWEQWRQVLALGGFIPWAKEGTALSMGNLGLS